MSIIELAALLTALGVGALGRELVIRLLDWRAGRAKSRRAEVDRAAAEKQAAIEQITTQKIAEVTAAHDERDKARERAQEERDRADGERKRAEKERDRADDEARRRRLAQEYASQLLTILYRYISDPPPWPDMGDTMPRVELNRIKRERDSS